jgi:hypothetical protein
MSSSSSYLTSYDSSWLLPSITSSGWQSGTAWADAEQVEVEDETEYAYCTPSGTYTQTLICRRFGNTADIITDETRATLTGIEVKIIRKASDANTLKDYQVFLADSDGVYPANIYGTPKADSNFWATENETIYYGSNTDLWGSDLTVSDITDKLTVGVEVQKISGSPTAYVDAVWIRVHWYVSPL